jgi:hypothetical protein
MVFKVVVVNDPEQAGDDAQHRETMDQKSASGKLAPGCFFQSGRPAHLKVSVSSNQRRYKRNDDKRMAEVTNKSVNHNSQNLNAQGLLAKQDSGRKDLPVILNSQC